MFSLAAYASASCDANSMAVADLRPTDEIVELRARYRVFEFEAAQEGHNDVAGLFAELRRLEQQQIAELLAGLRTRLGAEFESQKELA